MRIKNFQIFGLIFLTNLLNLPSINGARILGLFTSSTSSHLITHMSVARVLAEAGHNLTIVSMEEPKSSHPTIKHIVIPLTEQQRKGLKSESDIFVQAGNNLWVTIMVMFTAMRTKISLQYEALQDARFTELYKDEFDLVILGLSLNDFQLKIGAKFKCPVIVNSLTSPTILTNEFVGNPTLIEYEPPTKGLFRNFWQRLKTFFIYVLSRSFQFWLGFQMEEYYNKLLPNDTLPSLQEMRKNVSLVFCSSHFTQGPIRPNLPAVIEIGGIQIKDKADPLPKDIADFIDAGTSDGFILFTFGSKVYESNFNPEIYQMIFRVLASLDQKVIWKWDDLDNVPGKSPNILYKKWLPQSDLLAHPGIRLFITHAGKSGLNEAQYHGVPMLTLPIYGDQRRNAKNIAISGYGILMEMLEMTETDFQNGVVEILENPKYKDNIQRFSERFRDRPLKASESVVYWTDYVLRHHGAKHMQYPMMHLSSIEQMSLDVIGTILLVIYINYKFIKIIFGIIRRKLSSKKADKTKKKRKIK